MNVEKDMQSTTNEKQEGNEQWDCDYCKKKNIFNIEDDKTV